VGAEHPRVIGYLASWGVRTKGVRIAEIPADQLTHILYAFGHISEDGRAVLGDPCLDAGECGSEATATGENAGGNFAQLRALKQRYPHLQVLISIGGWGGSKYFSDVAATPEARRRYVQSSIDLFIHQWPGVFDGFDLDWEFPVSGGMPENRRRPEDRENYTLLLEEYRRQLQALGKRQNRKYWLSIAASAHAGELANLELDRLPAIVDWINVMTYDYHSTDTITHFNAPLYATTGDPTPMLNVSASMQALLDAGVPPPQLVIGVPFYGRGYGGVAPINHGLFQPGSREQAGEWGAEGIDYRVLMGKLPEAAGFQRFWHTEAQVPWLYNPASRIWISYDDPESVRRKAEYVRERGLGGIMFWELGGDDGSLLQAIHQGIGW
jgi:chitinase